MTLQVAGRIQGCHIVAANTRRQPQLDDDGVHLETEHPDFADITSHSNCDILCYRRFEFIFPINDVLRFHSKRDMELDELLLCLDLDVIVTCDVVLRAVCLRTVAHPQLIRKNAEIRAGHDPCCIAAGNEVDVAMQRPRHCLRLSIHLFRSCSELFHPSVPLVIAVHTAHHVPAVVMTFPQRNHKFETLALIWKSLHGHTATIHETTQDHGM